MSPVTRIHFASPLRRSSEWGRCPECVAWYKENRIAAIHASASVGLEHGLNTTQALGAYMSERHAREHESL